MIRLFGRPRVSTDAALVDEALSRSVAEILPSREALREVLLSGRRLRFYIGADATGPELHVGHATNFLLLERFRRLGHEVVVLFGDFTAMIGDPTDKDAARKRLSVAEVRANIASWRAQVAKVLDFSDRKNPPLIRRNSEWLAALSLEKVLELAASFTVPQLLERDMFERRLRDGKPVYLHEFLYPLLQGYDSVALAVDVEVGGTDQTFNMLAGRTLVRKYLGKEKFVIATTLLADPAGKKLMSKSEGSYIALSDSPEAMYGKTMALPDGVLRQMFIDATTLPPAEVDAVMELPPKEAKERLARELVERYHGKEAAAAAAAAFGTAAAGREVRLASSARLFEVLLAEGLAPSKSELKRLFRDRAVTDARSGAVFGEDAEISRDCDVRVGKHRFLRIRIR